MTDDRPAYPQRKQMRHPHFNYATPQSYFITLCTYQKQCLFPLDVPPEPGLPQPLTAPQSLMIQETLRSLPAHFPIRMPAFVIMPNHIHFLFQILPDSRGYDVPYIMQAFKSYTATQYGRLVRAGKAKAYKGKFWQKSYWDVIIRNDRQYQEAWQYILHNPFAWEKDPLYV